MNRMTRGSAWVAAASIAGAIATTSDPGMPTTVKMWALIVAGALNALHVSQTHATARNRDRAAVAIKAHAATIAAANASAEQAIAAQARAAVPAGSLTSVNLPGPAPIVVNSNPAPGAG